MNVNLETFRKIAQTLSATTLTLGSASIAVILFLINNQPNNISLIATFSVIGTAMLVSSALTTDWLLDSLTDDEWSAARNINYELVDSKKFNQFLSRITVFSFGYLLYAMSISALISSLVYLSSQSMKLDLLSFVGYSVSGIVFLKMMTKEFSRIFWILSSSIFVFYICSIIYIGIG